MIRLNVCFMQLISLLVRYAMRQDVVDTSTTRPRKPGIQQWGRIGGMRDNKLMNGSVDRVGRDTWLLDSELK
jgi:hypothetical protein